MAGHVPAIHLSGSKSKTWMPATGAGMTLFVSDEGYYRGRFVVPIRN
jgi:hypothetical protein